MDDYTVGSLAELISGKKSKNKVKVVKKELKMENKRKNKQSDDSEIPEPKKNKTQVNPKVKQNGANHQNKKKQKNGSNLDYQVLKTNKKNKEIPNNSENKKQKIKKNKKPKQSVAQEHSESEDEQLDSQISDIEVQLEIQNIKKTDIETDSESEYSDDNKNLSSDGEDFEKALDEIEGDESDNEETSMQINENKTLDSLLESDEEDSDSNEEMDEDENNDTATKKVSLKNSPEEIERTRRTVFVGNLPIKVTKTNVKKIFMKFGKVESVRLRCIPMKDCRVSKKVAMIKKDFHPDRNSLHAYVRYVTRDDALKSLKANGLVYKNHHLRVNLSDDNSTHDDSKAIFVGNIPFDAEEEELWKLFEPCGQIVGVRLIRDPRTMIGKGFGYVNFSSSDSVELALEMTDVTLKKRELRIKRSDNKAAKKNNKDKKPTRHMKRSKIHNKEGGEVEAGQETVKSVTVKEKVFQGKTSDKKKNKKIKNKKTDPKEKLVKQIAPK